MTDVSAVCTEPPAEALPTLPGPVTSTES